MNSIVDSFILQICTGNVDMHYDNLWILDSDFPTLAPNFDYGWCGQVDFYSKCNYNLQVVPLSFSCQNSARQTILDFLNYSSQEFVQYFIFKVSLMPCATDIFKKIKIQTGVEIPPYVSKQIFTEYQPLKSQILDFVELYVRKKKI